MICQKWFSAFWNLWIQLHLMESMVVWVTFHCLCLTFVHIVNVRIAATVILDALQATGFIMPCQWIARCIEYIRSKLIDQYGERRWIREMGPGCEAGLDLLLWMQLKSMALLPKNHCISQLKSLLCLRKERLCRLNEFQWLNVFVPHSGAKSYLMADTQFMAGPPFSQWQVTFVSEKALSKGRAKDRVLHSWKEEHKCCTWEMKWEKSSWFAHSTASPALGWRQASIGWPHCARLGPRLLWKMLLFFWQDLLFFQSWQSCLGWINFVK